MLATLEQDYICLRFQLLVAHHAKADAEPLAVSRRVLQLKLYKLQLCVQSAEESLSRERWRAAAVLIRFCCFHRLAASLARWAAAAGQVCERLSADTKHENITAQLDASQVIALCALQFSGPRQPHFRLKSRSMDAAFSRLAAATNYILLLGLLSLCFPLCLTSRRQGRSSKQKRSESSSRVSSASSAHSLKLDCRNVTPSHCRSSSCRGS